MLFNLTIINVTFSNKLSVCRISFYGGHPPLSSILNVLLKKWNEKRIADVQEGTVIMRQRL